MTYGRSNLRLKFRKGYAVPLYLDHSKDRSLIEAVIDFYEMNVGKPYGSIKWEDLRVIIGDDKLYHGLRKSMNYFYKPAEPRASIANPKLLRLRIFQLVNVDYGGFIPSEKRNEFLRSIERRLGIHNIDEVLWIDELGERPLIKVKKPTPIDVAEIYNFETIDTICTNSSELAVEIRALPSVLSSIAKVIGRYSKVYGLLYDIKSRYNNLRAVIEGPRSLFGRPTKYGLRLSLMLEKLLPLLYSETIHRWSIWSKTHFKRTTISIKIMSDDYRPELRVPENIKRPQPAFDSSIEERIFRALKSIGLSIVKDVEPIALGDLLYIPDMKIEVNGKSYYVEVAGYWRKEYAEKKAYKLHEITKLLNNFIVIADEKLKPYLKRLKVPVIYYVLMSGKPIVPYIKILKILRR